MGFYTGYSSDKLESSQKNLLDAVQSGFKNKGKNVEFTVEKMKLPESGLSLNVIKCTKTSNGENLDSKNSKPFVIMHGYAAGGAMFANNLAVLAYSLNRPVYAVDWVGFGASDRPKFSEKSVQKTMDFFINPFQEWLKMMKFSKIDLMGHSLGGFLTAHYCANYSGENIVDNLILASPAGVPHNRVDPTGRVGL